MLALGNLLGRMIVIIPYLLIAFGALVHVKQFLVIGHNLDKILLNCLTVAVVLTLIVANLSFPISVNCHDKMVVGQRPLRKSKREIMTIEKSKGFKNIIVLLLMFGIRIQNLVKKNLTDQLIFGSDTPIGDMELEMKKIESIVKDENELNNIDMMTSQ